VATRRVLLRTKWSTPEATAREFGLSAAELERIAKVVQGFLASYKGALTVRNGRAASAARRRRLRNTIKHSRQRPAVR
jgi:hypothetical protein